jgi:thioesterase domain-containing protein
MVRATRIQEAFWRAHQEHAPAAVLNLHWRLAVDADVDTGVLRSAWAALVRRHEALRTGFTERSGSLVQEVWADAEGSLGQVGWADDDQELRERLGRELHARPFDLHRPPLVRAVLLRSGGSRELHICGHRAVLDDHCLPVLLRDLTDAYDAMSRGREHAFEAEPVPFQVIAAEQWQALDGGRWGASEAHWRAELSGARPASIAARGPAGLDGELDVAVLRVPLSEAAAEVVRGAEGGPLAACLSGMRAVLGHTKPGVPLAVGVVNPNRPTARDRSIVGPLAVTVPVAWRLDPTEHLRVLLTGAQATMAAVREHGHVPAPATAGGAPSIVLCERPEPELPGAPVRPLPRAGSGIGPGAAIQVAVVSSRSPGLEIEYRTAAFDRGTIADLAADLDRVVALTARAPEVAAGAVPIRTGSGPAAASPGGPAPVTEPEARSSLVTLRAAGRPHVHLFHPGGGRSACYQALVGALPAGWTVTASDDSGQGDTIEGMADRYLAELLSTTGPPDLLGGWSMGGSLAYEAVRRLQGTGARPGGLVLIDSPPPIGFGPEPQGAPVVEGFAESLWNSLSMRRFLPVELVADEDDAMCALAAGLWRAGETARPDWLLQRLDEYRRHLLAVVRYVCADRISVPAVVIAAVIGDSYLDEWSRRLPPGTPVVRLSGGHFDVLREPLVAEVARQLTSLRDRVRSGPSDAR